MSRPKSKSSSSKSADKRELKKLRAKVKFIKKSLPRKESLPQNQVISDKKKVLDKTKTRTKVFVETENPCRPDGGRDGSGFLM